jgi:transcriptional regulator with XRE-family HTH domain
MQSERFLKAREQAKPEHGIFVSKNLALIDQIYQILDEKGWTQKVFARELGKSESEVSKWMTATHNFTLSSISKIEAVLGQEVLVNPSSFSNKFRATVALHANKIYNEAVSCFTEHPFTVAYFSQIDLRSNGKNTFVHQEKKMVFDKPATFISKKEQTDKILFKHEHSAA